MRKVSGTVCLLLAVATSVGLPTAPAGQDQWQTVTPEPTDEILANPHMGWETFHRTATEDRNLPPWIPSTVHYARWGWGELEPEPGKIHNAFLDDVLAATARAGQTLAFRVMCCSSTPGRPYHPSWLTKVGGRLLQTRHGDGPMLEVPDLDDPAVLQAHLDFIARLGARYDGHPGIAHVDLGSVGWWGEWHMSQSSGAPMPKPETQKRIVDAYLAAFKKTPLLMLIGGGPMLRHAVAGGTGWRADCLGDMGGFSRNWCHMQHAYPQMLPKAGATDAWKHAPVAWETCWDMRKWVAEGWPLRFIFNYALALHGSYINNKSAPLPGDPQVRPELERFLRRLGYRLVLRQLRHPAQVGPGAELPLHMQWQNTGSAPCYKPYVLAYRLERNGAVVVEHTSQVAVSAWMPGSVELFTEEFYAGPPDLPPGDPVAVSDRVAIPPGTPAGQYTLAIAVVDPQSGTPVVQLGIAGRREDGWYPLSRVTVARQ